MDRRLLVQVSEEGADAERLETLANYLRDELRQLDVEDVSTLRAPREAPPGTRTFDVVAFGWLVVHLGQAARRLGDVVSSVRRWLTAGDGTDRTVRLEIDGDVLELSGATAEDQQRLIDVFVQRHAAGYDDP